jgi:hypothetical protein
MSAAIWTVLAWQLVMANTTIAQQTAARAEPSCVSWLELPTRGLLAARAPASGTVQAVVYIGEGGRPSKVELTGGNRWLEGEVRVAMLASVFASRCQGRTLKFIFGFTIEDPPADELIPPGVRFVPPNRFDLVFRRLRPNREPPAPSRPPPAREP